MGGARPARVTLPSAAVTLLLGWGQPLTIHSGPEQGVSPSPWPAMIAGLQTAPMLAGFSGSASAVEIELTPLGAYRLLNLPLHHLAKTVIDPDHIMGAGWAANATEQLAAAPHWSRRWQILDALLTRRLHGETSPSPAATQAWNLLRDRDGAVSLRDLTLATGLGRLPHTRAAAGAHRAARSNALPHHQVPSDPGSGIDRPGLARRPGQPGGIPRSVTHEPRLQGPLWPDTTRTARHLAAYSTPAQQRALPILQRLRAPRPSQPLRDRFCLADLQEQIKAAAAPTPSPNVTSVGRFCHSVIRRRRTDASAAS